MLDGGGAVDTSESTYQNLSEIPTIWSDVQAAHLGGPAAQLAQERLVKRYGPAVLRYLFVLVKNVEDASDLFQQFAKGLIEGKMRRADPARGRFRHYLKTSLVNLYLDYCRARKSSPIRFTSDMPEMADTEESVMMESDREFLAIWRSELLKLAFDELLSYEKVTTRPYYTVLDLRLRHADVRTQELVDLYNEQTGQSLTVERMRKLLYEARRLFADKLLRLVEETLDHPGLNEVEEELSDLGLLPYCKEAINRRRNG